MAQEVPCPWCGRSLELPGRQTLMVANRPVSLPDEKAVEYREVLRKLDVSNRTHLGSLAALGAISGILLWMYNPLVALTFFGIIALLTYGASYVERMGLENRKAKLERGARALPPPRKGSEE